MPSGQISEDAWLCKPCNLLFSSWDKLHQHKGAMRRSGKPKHIHCKFCSEDFKTERGEIIHIQEKHAHAQNLECPACGRGPFNRLGGLVDHMENKCIRLDAATLAEMRTKKLEFSNNLQALTQESIKGNYTDYMPSVNGDARSQIAGHGRSRASSENTEPVRGRSTKTKVLTGQQVQNGSVTTPLPAPKTHEVLDINHPDHPGFNSARYFTAIIDQYVCPKTGCGKTFKKSGGLMAHLRSAASHFGNAFRCPYCLRTFGTLTAVTQHAESSTVRCQIRETDEYNAYLDQLTAGIVDVSISRHADGTPKYETTESARQEFGRSETSSVPGAAPSDAGKESYWDDKEIHW